ncbi:MAG: MG2 domain-containing protein [Gemmataceae bacterium]|nr:MG2 domain-containing protein [Gemmataceae bacterium]
MPGNHPARWSLHRRRLGMVASLLVGLAGLALLSQSHSLAQAPPVSQQAAAVFASDTKLHVAVSLLNPEERELSGRLDVELLGAGGKVLAQAGQAVRQQALAAGYRFELAADKKDAGSLSIRARFGGKTLETPLNKILLHKGHETSLTAGVEFFAGSTAPFRLSVHGARTPTETLPLPGSEVTLTLKAKDKSHALYTGRTGKDGQIEANFQVPSLPTGQYTLVVATRSALGEEKLERPVRIADDAKILLVTDRPIYQPGHLIHLRALTLRPFDLKPVEGADLLFEVEDAKGNKVFKKAQKTSPYGVASVDFQLADEVNMGDYRIRAVLGDIRAEKTVNVKRYVLPKFKANVTSDKTFYLPKETVRGSVQVDYFFGKPVSGGTVKVTAETFDVAFRKFHTWEGKTDNNGHAKFEIKLPDYFVGQPLQQGNALVKLEVKVTDTADHSETITRTYSVSDQPIRVSLIPEGGRLTPGMENRVFAAATYPDGTPAPGCDVKLWSGKDTKAEPVATVKTNDSGLAEFKLSPDAKQFRQGPGEQRPIEMLGGQQIAWAPKILYDVTAEARDAKGNVARAVAELNSHPFGENVLLRLDKAIYKSGDSLNVNVHTSAGMPTVYLDITRGGQILLSRWMDVKDGKATHRLDLPQTVFGSLEVHAYQVLRSGEIIRDSRVVYVHSRNDLKVEVQPDKAMHKPGENGRIQFRVTDSAGKPTSAALGVIIVDEAVYALQEMQPGLEKVYFTLQEELLKPQVQIKYSPGEGVDGLIRQPVLPAPKQQIAQVLLTSVKAKPPARWDVAPALERRNRYEAQVQQIGWGLYHHAWSNDAALRYDDKANRWVFADTALKGATTVGHIHPQALNAPFGGQLTLEELARTEKEFSAEHLTRALTRHRLERVSAAFITYTNAKKAELLKDGKWTFPAAILAQAVTTTGGLDATWLRDGWGQGFKLVRRDRKAENKTGHTQFDQYEIVSAGPDRDYQTADDVRWPGGDIKTAGGWWKEPPPIQLVRLDPRFRQLEREHLLGMQRDGLRRDFDRMERGAGQGGFPGGPVPGGFPQPRAGAPPFAVPDAKGAPGKNKKDGGGGFGGGDDRGQPGGGGAPPLKVREYFPETMLWQPALITDENGVANLAVNFADSITTWRLTASASSRGGALGGETVGLKVFQDFFVDIDLPVALTQNDEVAFPVAVYNYLKNPQTVKLELQQEPWFTLIDTAGPTRTLKLEPNEVTSVKFRIKANKIGWQPLTVKAFGSKLSDAVKRVVEIVPDGQKVERVVNDRLSGSVTQTVEIPQNSVPDSAKLLVRIYPGVMAQVLEGMEGMLRLPGG